MAKIVFNITEQGAWAEIEQADGTMKKWDENLTYEEYSQICAAGLMMQKGSFVHAMITDNTKTPRRLEKIEQLLTKAGELAKKIFNIE